LVRCQIDDGAQVTVDDLREWCQEVGLAEEYLPAPTLGINALKLAINQLLPVRLDVQRAVVEESAPVPAAAPELTPFRVVELGCEEHTRDRLTVVYRLVYQQPHVPPEVVGFVRYNRPDRNERGNIPGTDSVEHWFFDTLPADEKARLAVAVEGIRAAARHHRDYLHAGRLRDFIRNVILAGDALVLDPPGVYWVPDGETVTVARGLIGRIGGSVKVTQVANIGEHRVMLSEDLDAQICRDAASLRAMLDDARSKGSLTLARKKSLRNDYLGLIERAKRLSTLIGHPVGPDATDRVNALRGDFIDALGGR
jgi:hypothetical protein